MSTSNSKGCGFVLGNALCVVAAALAILCGHIERAIGGREWLEPLVLAIVIGAIIRAVWTPPDGLGRGIAFASKTPLEIAIVLLGLQLSLSTIAESGGKLIVGIAVVICVVLAFSYLVGRYLGLPHELALLISCGNAICGNSAIMAIAPVIGAKAEDIVASIGFTALLGIVVVIVLPVTGNLLLMSQAQYGVFAGLTVYAVPQVIAATISAGPVSLQLGTLVKLIRVIMLGPLIVVLSLMRSFGPRCSDMKQFRKALPTFILGFLLMSAVRSAFSVPDRLVEVSSSLVQILSVVSMAGLGLSVDLHAVRRSGLRVACVVTISLLGLGLASLGLIHAIDWM